MTHFWAILSQKKTAFPLAQCRRNFLSQFSPFFPVSQWLVKWLASEPSQCPQAKACPSLPNFSPSFLLGSVCSAVSEEALQCLDLRVRSARSLLVLDKGSGMAGVPLCPHVFLCAFLSAFHQRLVAFLHYIAALFLRRAPVVWTVWGAPHQWYAKYNVCSQVPQPAARPEFCQRPIPRSLSPAWCVVLCGGEEICWQYATVEVQSTAPAQNGTHLSSSLVPSNGVPTPGGGVGGDPQVGTIAANGVPSQPRRKDCVIGTHVHVWCACVVCICDVRVWCARARMCLEGASHTCEACQGFLP